MSRVQIIPKLSVDQNWLHRISGSLELFHKIKDGVFNCRCNVCGDSVKNKSATRMYFYVKKGNLNVFCHNCGYSKSFYSYMKDCFQYEFDVYKRETLFDCFKAFERIAPVYHNLVASVDTDDEAKQQPDVLYSDFKTKCTPIADLDDDHPAKLYLKGRGMTPMEYSRLMFTEDFGDLARYINPESGEKLKAEPRIVIPFVTPDGVVDMMQGRSLDPDSHLRYISIKRHDDVEKIYGRYDLDDTQLVRCVEGPLDSLFVDNCIATCDANLNRSDADVLIWDIQPRNKEIIRYMEEAIENQRSLVIWPIVPDKKLDINDLIKKGVTRQQIMAMIDANTYNGLTAKLKFSQWKKL